MGGVSTGRFAVVVGGLDGGEGGPSCCLWGGVRVSTVKEIGDFGGVGKEVGYLLSRVLL